MRRSDLSRYAPVLAAVAGMAAMLLRMFLYAGAVDATGRLASGHPLSWAVALITLAVVVLTAAAVYPQKGSAAYQDNFSANLLSGVGYVVFAVGILTTVRNNPPMLPGALGMAWTYLGYASIPCLALAGYARIQGRCPSVPALAVPTLFLTLHLITHYQLWCSNPQLQDVVFPLFATVCLIVTAYQQAAFAADMGSRRQLLFAGCLALYLCLAEVTVSQYPELYRNGALWAAFSLCHWGSTDGSSGV